ncbi:helix-turn-helix domain-containing protein [Nonomuraea sp. B12E4]|uniref:ArsR/SmtB family transcription factor n=1 Tax=Nonomuraea sp. B12E4 TaxID=3153564 RepID=UPI00325E0AAE
MGYWQVNADTLARGRFTISALAEATAGLLLLGRGSAAHPGEQTWLDAHLPAFRARLAGDPITTRLVRAALPGHWIADFLVPAPSAETTFEEELRHVRATPPETVHADLEVSLGGPLPAELDRPDLAGRAADLLDWVWRETVLPTWPRRRRILEADIVARTEKLGQGGRAAVLVLLDSPMSTTQLVALTGQGLGSVGRHLKVLLDAGLVRRRRAGRSVLYWRTETGEALVAGQRDP